MKRTPLHATFVQSDARLTNFGGWEMPVFFTNIADEHHAVRRDCGIFDISHMGEFVVKGPAAQSFLNTVLSSRVTDLSVGEGQYTLLCDEKGGVIDDLYLFRLFPDIFTLIVNASRIEEDWKALTQFRDPFEGDVELENVSDQTAALAIQGPKVGEWIDDLLKGTRRFGASVDSPNALKKNQIAQFESERWPETSIWVSRTGYTGEDGFEILTSAEIAESLWATALEVGAPFGIKPAGLGARDTLRLEAGFPLYGADLSLDRTPLEAGLGFFVDLDNPDYQARDALAAQKSAGITEKLVALKATQKSAPPRNGYPIYAEETGGEPIGAVTSGAPSPTLGTGIALGYVPKKLASVGAILWIEARNRRFPAEIVKRPFYKRGLTNPS